MSESIQAGQLLARGVCRHLRSLNFTGITEFVPARGLRVDVMAIGPKSEIWVIECKSCRADFNADNKWQNYLEWCDKFFWCVDADFPTDILPDETGLILADPYSAEVIRYGPEMKLPPARRKSLILSVARTSMSRLQACVDPSPSQKFSEL